MAEEKDLTATDPHSENMNIGAIVAPAPAVEVVEPTPAVELPLDSLPAVAVDVEHS